MLPGCARNKARTELPSQLSDHDAFHAPFRIHLALRSRAYRAIFYGTECDFYFDQTVLHVDAQQHRGFSTCINRTDQLVNLTAIQ